MTRSALSPAAALLLLCALVCAAAFGVREVRVLPDGNVHVAMLDVGQGDALLITGPTGKQILVDGGPNTVALEKMSEEMSLFDRSIDLIILSHPHLDHVVALPDVLRRYNVGAVMISGAPSSTGKYRELLDLLRGKQTSVIIANPAEDMDLGNGLLLDVLWPTREYIDQGQYDDLNDSSVVFKLIYGEDSMLFTGDLEDAAEQLLLASGADIDADILKVGHHGSRGSSGTGFLLAVSPELAVISAGADNSYKHPHAELIDRLDALEIPYKATLWDRTIEMEMDGI